VASGVSPPDHDRRQNRRDRRRVRDRRSDWPFLPIAGSLGPLIRWFTGPWSSANGLTWLRLLIVFLVVEAFFLTVYRIPTASMEPTLHGDPNFIRTDRVAVNKTAFGIAWPFARQSAIQYAAPERWDIVAFWSPQPNAEGDVLIKRVVGLPGERVRIVNGELRIDGEAVVPPEEIADAIHYTSELLPTESVVRRHLLLMAKLGHPPIDLSRDDKARYRRLLDTIERLHAKVKDLNVATLNRIQVRTLTDETHGEVIALVDEWWSAKLRSIAPARYGVHGSIESQLVPEGHYFLLGDNGLESVDSRMFGWVPRESLIGRVFAIVTPPGRARDLSGFLDRPPGRALFFILIAVLAAYELVPGFILFSTRVRGPIEPLGLRQGDRVFVNRIVYGPRVPFASHRLFWWRRPKPGDVVCFSLSRRGGVVDPYHGTVLRGVDSATNTYAVTGPDSRVLQLRPADIIGRTSAVWWPLRQARRVKFIRRNDA